MTEALPGKHEGRPGHFLNELRETFASQTSRTAIYYKDRALTYGELSAGPAIGRAAARVGGRARRPGGDHDRGEAAVPGGPSGNAVRGGGLAPLEPAAHPRRAALLPPGQRRRGSWSPATINARSSRHCGPSCRSCRSRCPTPTHGMLPKAVSRSQPSPTSPVPDALQLGNDRPAQGGRAHARQPRLQLCARCEECWRFTPDDVLVNVLPLFHIHGLSFATHLSLLTGASMLMEDSFHPRRTLEAVGRARSSWRSPPFITAFSTGPSSRRSRGSGVTCGSSRAARRRSAPKCSPSWRRRSGGPSSTATA